MLEAFLEILKGYGLGAAMAAIMAFILYHVLKFIKENIYKIVEQSQKREEAQHDVIKSQQKTVDSLAKEIRSVRRAHTRDHIKMSQGLTEIIKALGRINGYKNNKEE